MPKNVYYCTVALILHASKVMLKILQARLQHPQILLRVKTEARQPLCQPADSHLSSAGGSGKR